MIFLSHANADIELVEAFETLLSKALNITSANIFCSSLEGQGVKKGADFVDAIKGKATEAKAVVALLSPAYLESPFCLAELGAAWALNTHRFPIVVPPNTFEVMKATLLGVVGVKIDQQEALTQLLEDIGEALSLPAPTAGVRARAIRDFFKAWP
ncbi:toll/interleukin-1 receptor domain-containing protein, partial [Rhizobium ruizarguesonis]